MTAALQAQIKDLARRLRALEHELDDLRKLAAATQEPVRRDPQLVVEPAGERTLAELRRRSSVDSADLPAEATEGRADRCPGALAHGSARMGIREDRRGRREERHSRFSRTIGGEL